MIRREHQIMSPLPLRRSVLSPFAKRGVFMPWTVPAGFTLIELLVVVAIISLLVSILLPSLTRAKMLARNAICLTNLRTLSSATVGMYANDNNGYLVAKNNPYWLRMCFVGIDVHCADTGAPKDRPPLNPYVGLPEDVTGQFDISPGPAACPSDTLPLVLNGETYESMLYAYGTSYAYNSYISSGSYCELREMLGLYCWPEMGTSWDTKDVRIDEVEDASATVCVADWYIECYSGWGASGFPIHSEDGSRVQLGLCDGHAEGVSVQPYQASGPGWKLDYRDTWPSQGTWDW